MLRIFSTPAESGSVSVQTTGFAAFTAVAVSAALLLGPQIADDVSAAVAEAVCAAGGWSCRAPAVQAVAAPAGPAGGEVLVAQLPTLPVGPLLGPGLSQSAKWVVGEGAVPEWVLDACGNGAAYGDFNRQGFSQPEREAVRVVCQWGSGEAGYGDARDVAAAVTTLVNSRGREGWGDLALSGVAFLPLLGGGAVAMVRGSGDASRALRNVDWSTAFSTGAAQLGETIGAGSQGVVHAVSGHPGLAVKVRGAGASAPADQLQIEAAALNQLRALGIPTAHHGVITWKDPGTGATRTGLLMDRIDGVHSSAMESAQGAAAVTERTVSDLRSIYRVVEEAGIQIDDFQFLVSKQDGSVRIIDPDAVRDASDPAETAALLETMDDAIQTAESIAGRKGGGAGTKALGSVTEHIEPAFAIAPAGQLAALLDAATDAAGHATFTADALLAPDHAFIAYVDDPTSVGTSQLGSDQLITSATDLEPVDITPGVAELSIWREALLPPEVAAASLTDVGLTFEELSFGPLTSSFADAFGITEGGFGLAGGSGD